MATRTHPTVEYAWDTNISTLATNTTLGTATRYDFPAITLYVPESSLTFLSAVVEITVRLQDTVARDLTGWRIGINLGAVGFDDVDYTPSALSHTGEAWELRFTRDVTDYFVANWSGSSMTSEVGVAFATSAASIVGNITAKIYLTYTYDDTSATYVKTVRIPIQSDNADLTNVQAEIGTAGANPAPANQIPLLDTFLPEASKVIRRSWIEVVANNGGITTTDFNMFLQIDATPEVARATIEMALTTQCWYKDIYIYDTGTHSTASAHALNARSSVTDRFDNTGAVLYVTYEYDRATTTSVLNSLIMPMLPAGQPPVVSSSSTAEADAYSLELWVPEPGSIGLVQSGILIYTGLTSVGASMVLWAGGQAERTYTIGSAFYTYQTIVHRTDHGTSPWTLSRGKNTLTWYNYVSTSTRRSVGAVYAIINYTSDVAADGVSVHNGSTLWAICDYQASGAVTGIRDIASGDTRTPVVGSSYFINNYGFDRLAMWGSSSGSILGHTMTQLQILPGELQGAGWLTYCSRPYMYEELGQHDGSGDLTVHFNQTDQQTGKMVIDDARNWRIGTINASLASYNSVLTWLTHHEVTFAAAGSISGYAGDGSGITVEVYDDTDGKRVASAVSAVGGAYTATVYDDTQTYFAEAREDATHVGRSDNATPS